MGHAHGPPQRSLVWPTALCFVQALPASHHATVEIRSGNMNAVNSLKPKCRHCSKEFLAWIVGYRVVTCWQNAVNLVM